MHDLESFFLGILQALRTLEWAGGKEEQIRIRVLELRVDKETCADQKGHGRRAGQV